jgi:hypothetical protein
LAGRSSKAGTIAIVMTLAVVPTARAADHGALTLTKNAHGTLAIAAHFGPSSTLVRISGRVRVGRKDVRVVIRTCADAVCKHPAHSASRRATLMLTRGMRQRNARLRLPRSKGIIVTAGGDRAIVARVTTAAVPTATAPDSSPPAGSAGPTVALPAPQGPAPGPSDPPVHFDYDPSLSDAVVRCEPEERVEVGGIVVPLKAGQSFHVDQQNVRCLPADFPTWTAQRVGTPTVRLLVATVDFYVIVANADGVPVWWMRSPTGGLPMDAKLLDSDTLAWTYNFFTGYRLDASYDLRGLDGPLKATVGGDSIDEHDLQRLPNGDYLAIAYVPRSGVDLSPIGGPTDATVLDGEIRELAPDGSVVWRWSTKDHIGISESGPEGFIVLGGSPYDVVHINSVEDDGNGIVFSARHLDAVYRVDKATGEIDWKLGGTHRPESLTFVNDPIGRFGGQHDARIDSDGTLTVHDNELFKDKPPRAVRYGIDPGASTATLVEQVTDPAVTSAGCCGSARSLPNGHWLVSWGQNARIAEYDAGGTPALVIDLGNNSSYRVVPVTGDTPTLAELRAGMDTRSGS